MAAFMFLCTQATELECLELGLVGTTQSNAIWAMAVKPNDDIYLLNFQSGIVRGPYSASSSTDCHEPTAWQGHFPVQVRITSNTRTRQANRGVTAPDVLKRSRPFSGNLEGSAVKLDAWMQENGDKLGA